MKYNSPISVYSIGLKIAIHQHYTRIEFGIKIRGNKQTDLA